MKFHGLMLVRDEADVLAQTLTHLLTWIDWIYVLDLGSTDSTWEILQEFSAKDQRIVLHSTSPIVFHDGLRCMLFDSYRHRFRDGDWVIRADADEFYHVLPPNFVRDRLRRGETCVYLSWYFFRLANHDVAKYENGRVDITADRNRPIEERRRYYKIPDYSEPRMFRYRTSMQWPINAAFPFNAGYIARERIPIRHYPHRDPWQMMRRYRLRAAMMTLKADAGPHWKLADWRQDVIDIDDGIGGAAEKNEGVGLGAAKGHTAGPLLYWQPGTSLPEIYGDTHLASRGKRMLQRLIHPACLPLLDRWRPQFLKNFRPEMIPDDVTEQLRGIYDRDQNKG